MKRVDGVQSTTRISQILNYKGFKILKQKIFQNGWTVPKDTRQSELKFLYNRMCSSHVS